MISSDVLEKRRYYVKPLAEIVQFLAINELAFCGSYDVSEHNRCLKAHSRDRMGLSDWVKFSWIINEFENSSSTIFDEVLNCSLFTRQSFIELNFSKKSYDNIQGLWHQQLQKVFL